MAAVHSPTLEQRLSLRERPAGRAVMRQCWDRLLFLHWRIKPQQIQERLPRGLWVDTFDDDAWLGVVPFFMRGIHIRGLPRIPSATDFLELNLRTYVHDDRGIPGVWFFSLDANSWLTVLGARTWFGLPYHYARMSASVDPERDRVDYHWQRRGSHAGNRTRFEYEPGGPCRTAEPGTLEFFLVERYLLYACGGRSGLYSGRVWHDPYRFSDAAVIRGDDHVSVLNGFPAFGRPPDHAVVSPGVEVDVFGLEPA